MSDEEEPKPDNDALLKKQPKPKKKKKKAKVRVKKEPPVWLNSAKDLNTESKALTNNKTHSLETTYHVTLYFEMWFQ